MMVGALVFGNPNMVKTAKQHTFFAGASMRDIFADPFQLTPNQAESSPYAWRQRRLGNYAFQSFIGTIPVQFVRFVSLTARVFAGRIARLIA